MSICRTKKSYPSSTACTWTCKCRASLKHFLLYRRHSTRCKTSEDSNIYHHHHCFKNFKSHVSAMSVCLSSCLFPVLCLKPEVPSGGWSDRFLNSFYSYCMTQGRNKNIKIENVLSGIWTDSLSVCVAEDSFQNIKPLSSAICLCTIQELTLSVMLK